MSSDPLAPYSSWNNPNSPIFVKIPAQVSTLAVSSLTGNTLNVVSTFTKNLLADYSETTEAFIYDILTIDNQKLTANNTSLLLNGVPIATIANLSSIADWSIYPQTSTVQGNKQSTIGLSYLSASTIGAVNLTASNIFTQNLMAFNIVNFQSTVIDVYESTIQADIKLANISTANISNLYVSTGSFSTLNSINGNFNNISAGTTTVNTIAGISATFSNFTASTITVSSIITPPVTSGSFSSITVVSNTNTGSLTVGNNNTTSFASAPVFSDGGNFNGTRPNFNSGIVTSGPNNFNNQNLDNVGRITGNTVFVGSPNYLNTQTSSFTKILNDRGADVGGNSVVELTAQYGAATRVNITAGQSSAYAPTPTQIITLTANGATSLSQNAVGGRVSIVANAGSGSGCNILGFGQIDLTAYSSLPFAGVIKESAGSILAYSGLTSPLVGIYGYSYYSALNCLSLTAGATTPSGSYPGVVYLRGDNGTKVVNGFYADTANVSGTTTTSNIVTNSVNSFSGQGITIQAPVNNINFIASTATFQCPIDGNLSVKSLINLSSINGAPYTPGGGGSVVSSFTSLATSSFTVSSINGQPYTPGGGGGGFVSTATSDLNMNGFAIRGNPINLTDPFGDQIYVGGGGVIISNSYGTTINLDSNGNNAFQNGLTYNFQSAYNDEVELGNSAPYIYPGGGSFVVNCLIKNSANNGVFYVGGGSGLTANTIDLTTNSAGTPGYSGNITITALSSITITSGSNYQNTATGNIVTGTPAVMSNQAQTLYNTVTASTINTCPETYFSGDIRVSSLTRHLVSADIPQPVLQYGFISTSGSSGTVTVTIPQRYTSQGSYIPFATMMDTPPAQLFTSSISRGSFLIGWSSGGSGAQLFGWQTMGT